MSNNKDAELNAIYGDQSKKLFEETKKYWESKTSDEFDKIACRLLHEVEFQDEKAIAKAVVSIANHLRKQDEERRQELIDFVEWEFICGYAHPGESLNEWQQLNTEAPTGLHDDDDDNWECFIGEKITTAQLYELYKQEPKYRT